MSARQIHLPLESSFKRKLTSAPTSRTPTIDHLPRHPSPRSPRLFLRPSLATPLLAPSLASLAGDHKERYTRIRVARIDSVTSAVITNGQRRKSNEWLFYEFLGGRWCRERGRKRKGEMRESRDWSRISLSSVEYVRIDRTIKRIFRTNSSCIRRAGNSIRRTPGYSGGGCGE